jgi:predicted RNase H-related nuclease YkuK (DUF458 family)
MLNAQTNVLFLFTIINVYSNPLDSIPIAEYCIGHGKKVFCNSYDDYYGYNNCYNEICNSTDIHLHLKTNFRELFKITTCVTYYDSNYDRFSNFTNKFLIHDDLKVEGESVTWDVISSVVEWHFAEEVPIYEKNGKQIDFNKYYEKGKIIPVEWELKASCGSLYNVVYSGKYFVRITGECE